ncbi:hypothetical protein QBZ16_001200 [Prototheca wickerhamii]|uniref:Uncharacterized protein n=1 Tax=Prototheca wickerhamii TaxID=3111 RepID=A0AAD9IE02_PROWI|nr:hypothetical protein QBZ16_001200 [Prototheca wickerhamii]
MGDGLDEAVKQAELSLVLNKFKEAEHLSKDVLRKTIYDPGHTKLEDRAAVVLIQSLYETRRFASVKGELSGFFGRLSAVPVNALLLFISLALDFSDARAEAQALTLELLQARSPQGPGGWTRRQYAALLHLYVFEMLLPEVREPSQAARWLEESSLPIPPALRASLGAELAAAYQRMQEAGGDSLQDLRKNSAARAVVPQRTASSLLGAGVLPALRTGRADAAAPGEAAGEHADPGAPWRAWPVSWRDASAALGSMAGPGETPPPADDAGAAAPPYDSAQVFVGGALLAILGYVVVHRRRQVASGAHSALRALGDVLRMGLQLSPSSVPH